MSSANPRLFLQQAAEALESTLQRNDHKRDWATLPLYLLDLLEEEILELKEALATRNPAEIRHEALDVALCALMVWAQAGGSNTVNRGREVPHG